MIKQYYQNIITIMRCGQDCVDHVETYQYVVLMRVTVDKNGDFHTNFNDFGVIFSQKKAFAKRYKYKNSHHPTFVHMQILRTVNKKPHFHAAYPFIVGMKLH